ncbi:hypothetical protein BDA99DRAFT_498359 [Phascolomyces articulosus]|uniref:Protection of telomeres protein 1 n=1 Tax=Phascolomyces articulosus TaxID=60185 RepID=A0AAD5K923_9FUNG|nr:hypothetical protein BDA99DRAFT_498359 [Phascolomyces articulosus]
MIEIPIVEQLKALGMKPISEVREGFQEKLYAVVKSTMPLRKTSTVDHFMMINISDPSVAWNSQLSSINMFHPKPAAFPLMAKAGDIVIFTNMKMKLYQRTKKQFFLDKTVSSCSSRWTLIDRTKLNAHKFPLQNIQYELTENDLKVVQLLYQWYHDSKGLPIGANNDPMDVESHGQQHSNTKDDVNEENEMNPPLIRGSGYREIVPTYKISARFFDYIGMVVSYNLEAKSRASMYLTDYTENPRPRSVYATEGTIESKLVIQCTMWDENAIAPFKLGLKYGDIVYLCNVQSEYGHGDTLELKLRGQINTPGGIGKCRIDLLTDSYHPYVRAIKLRKARYEKCQNSISSKTQMADLLKTVSTISKQIEANASSINDVLLDHTPAQKYKIRAKITDYKPHNPDGWIQKWCRQCESTYPPSNETCKFCQAALEFAFKGAFLCEGEKNTKDQDNKLVLIIHGEDSVSYSSISSVHNTGFMQTK